MHPDVSGLKQVPSACDLGRIVPQLAYLRNFAGCVELPLRKAGLLDPNNLAAIPGPEGRQGREVLSQALSSPHNPSLKLLLCFNCNMALLKNKSTLINLEELAAVDVLEGLGRGGCMSQIKNMPPFSEVKSCGTVDAIRSLLRTRHASRKISHQP